MIQFHIRNQYTIRKIMTSHTLNLYMKFYSVLTNISLDRIKERESQKKY